MLRAFRRTLLVFALVIVGLPSIDSPGMALEVPPGAWQGSVALDGELISDGVRGDGTDYYTDRWVESSNITFTATVAANGFRFRVPYGTLLCVSDKPAHGEIKMRSMANVMYRESISQHLRIGLEAVKILRDGGAGQVHSRKLRSFDEPAFR